MSETQPINPQKLQERMALLGYKQASLAKVLRVDQTLIGKILQGKVANTKHLPALARTLGTTSEYLTDLNDDPNLGAPKASTAGVMLQQISEKFDLVKIIKIADEFGLGETFLDGGELSEELLISRSWLQVFTNAAPNDVVIIQGVGNSMEPTISNGDWLICNKGISSPKRMDDLWVFTHHGMGGIKRIRKDTEGRIELLSDNPLVSNQIATESALIIHARVDAIVKRV